MYPERCPGSFRQTLLSLLESSHPDRIDAAVLQRQDIQNRILQTRLASRSGTKFLELVVRDGSPAAGARLADLQLPQSCIVVSIVRSERVLIPRGNTKLERGDTVTLFVETELERILRENFGDVTEG